jgi:hydroxymethylglutaryl-CoA reductase
LDIINGFSRFNKQEKINWLAKFFDHEDAQEIKGMSEFWHTDLGEQKLFDEFSENTLTNFFLPYGIAPNFIIDNNTYAVPMVIEESSVVAAASKGAKFWASRGGFKTTIISTNKIGHVHFTWGGDPSLLEKLFKDNKQFLLAQLTPLTANMQKRGGGIVSFKLKDLTSKLDNFYQFQLEFNTCDAMGANFINSILEELSTNFKSILNAAGIESLYDANMCILSNYTPDCLVEAQVDCSYDELTDAGIDGHEFAQRFKRAVDIATIDTYRAVTHNKGILNGIDAVILATGNDFRAVEACAHAFASKDGQYKSLSTVELEQDRFIFKIQLPLAIGTVGGLTNLHPMAKKSLKILGNPDSKKLMSITACVGLAQNFSALRSLVTTGIQKGHMKMHLLNICKQLGATTQATSQAREFFEEKIVSYTAVRNFLNSLNYKQ